MGSYSPFSELILDKRRTEWQLTTASEKNTSQPSKTPTVALGPSGNPRVLQVPAGTSLQHGCPAVLSKETSRGSSSHGVREMGKEGRAVVGHGTRGSW